MAFAPALGKNRTNTSHGTHQSYSSFSVRDCPCLPKPTHQKSEIAYDITFRFCQRFLPRGDRTIDQMIHAARSGKQNIAEASQASGTSKEMEIKLTNVARASLEELLLDDTDDLRVRDLKQWDKDSNTLKIAIDQML